jgi:glycosyltransferase involved in cell wall biosynthesis
MFSIVIPTWNNLPYIKLLIESLRKNSKFPHQILIHVNDGSDGTLKWVQEQGLEHTASLDNIGICFAVNRAAALATQKYLVYMNDDMVALPGWDVELVKYAENFGDQRFMLSSTMIEPSNTGNKCVAVADFGRSAEEWNESLALQSYSNLKRPNWMGSTWPPTLVPTWMWQEVGGYSTEFSPGMSSDNDFTMKLYHAGCRIFLGIGSSLVYHFACISTGRIKKNDGRKQFLRKWSITQREFDSVILKRGVLANEPYEVIDSLELKKFKFKSELRIRFKP